LPLLGSVVVAAEAEPLSVTVTPPTATPLGPPSVTMPLTV
jgi:hypothetical protein